jgi:hypothetical protein
MSIQVYQASGGGTYGVFPKPIISPRNPTTTDIVSPTGEPYQILQGWNNNLTDDTYIYLGSGIWVEISSLAGALTSLTSTAGTVVTPTAGNIQLAGTTNQITVTAGSSVLTFSIPAVFIAPGSIASTTSITAGNGLTATLGNITASAGNIVATLGNITSSAGSVSAATTVSAGTTITAGTGITSTTGPITATNGNLVLGTAGNKLVIASGANASVGTATLGAGGTVIVATTTVTASSIIYISVNTPGGTQGIISAPTASIIAGTSFVINSSEAADTSTVNWMIIN